MRSPCQVPSSQRPHFILHFVDDNAIAMPKSEDRMPYVPSDSISMGGDITVEEFCRQRSSQAAGLLGPSILDQLAFLHH